MDVSTEEAAQNSHTILSQIIEKLEAVESGKCLLLEIESVLKKFDENARTLMDLSRLAPYPSHKPSTL